MPRRLLQLLGATEIDAAGRFLCWLALFGLIAGGGKAMLRRKPGTSWADVVANMFAAMIAGVSVGAGLLYVWPLDHQLLILAISNVAAWCGSNLLDVAGNAAMGRVRNAIRNETNSD